MHKLNFFTAVGAPKASKTWSEKHGPFGTLYSVNAFLCKLCYFEFLVGFVRPEVGLFFNLSNHGEICPVCQR